MTKYVANDGRLITGDGDYYIATVNKKRDLDNWFGTFLAYGDFAGGSITWKISPDSGTTKLDLRNASGSSVVSTADDKFTSCLAGGANNSDAPLLYASLSGATGPSLYVVLYDNNG